MTQSHSEPVNALPAPVLLVSMPFGALERPSLGLALLQAEARRSGFECDTRYLGFDLAEEISVSVYQWVTHTVPYETFAGDWLFADALYGPDSARSGEFVEQILREQWHLGSADLTRLDRLRGACSAFIDDAVTTIDWSSYGIVGFTCTFQQNIASLALAKRLALAHPHLTLLFGGANWEGEMGIALHEAFGFVDIVCRGEADRTFPALLAALAADRPLDDIAGLVFRGEDGATIATSPAETITNLDALPVPDYEPYFDTLLDSSAAAEVAPTLLVETSRGCWWGAHSHCTFCGLNGATLQFRSKSPERALTEFDKLAEQWSISNFMVVDNILDMRYFRTLLAELANPSRDYQFFWEVKANLSRSQVQLLATAGVDHIQPGIESLSDGLLDIMRKGTSRLRNAALLKWCREYGITPEWNLLFGFPAEAADDYHDMTELAVTLSHLEPPSGQGQIRLDRFSPYHNDPADFGMTNVRPAAPLHHLYRCDPALLARISYYFDFDFEDGQDPARFAPAVRDAIATWNKLHDQSEFWLIRGSADKRVLVDRRGTRQRTAHLTGWKSEVYDACDRPCSRAELDQLDTLSAVAAADVDRFLDRCAATGAMLRVGDTYLSLAVHRPPRRTAEPSVIRHIPVTVST